jgi:hypothetical protein
MEQRDEELITSLLPQNPELKVAWDEHRRLGEVIDGFAEQGHLTAPEELEKKNLQKLKLVEKDKVQRFLEEYRRDQGANSSP